MIDSIVRKPFHMLKTISGAQPKTVHNIAKQSQATYSHTSQIMMYLRKRNIIIGDKCGRELYCKLTKKGEKIVEYFWKIDEIFKRL